MKKLTIILIVILLGMFLLNTARTVAVEMTLPLAIQLLEYTFNTLTDDELDVLAERITKEELLDSKTLIRQWYALYKVSTEINIIISERWGVGKKWE